MACSYQYQPLSSSDTHIRLLELLPGRGIIQCRLKVTEFEEAKYTYEPISYCWKAYSRRYWLIGPYEEKMQRTCRVLVDGVGFHITENLRAALRRMRLKTLIRVLWVDAICINQADDNEKSAQVAMMGDIYRSGDQTLMWLGDADCLTGRAFRLLKLRSGHVWEASDPAELYDEPTDEADNQSGDSGANKCHPRHLRLVWAYCQDIISVLTLCSIFDRPYFERAWIVQEVVLSDNAVVMSGKHEIIWADLYQGLYTSLRGSLTTARVSLIAQGIFDLWNKSEHYCLDRIISKLSHTKTLDPRDKLYSALGLHQNCMICGSMAVDYSKDVDEVFLDSTKVLLSRSPFLDLLSMSYGASRPADERIPSWVWNPDPRSAEYHLSRAQIKPKKPFQASQGWHSRPEFRGRMLGLLGYVFDDVRTVGKVLPPHTSYWTQNKLLEALQCYFSWVDTSGMHERGISDAEANVRTHAFRSTLKSLNSDGYKLQYSNRDDDEDARKFESFHAEIMKRFSIFLSPGAKGEGMRVRLRLWAAIESFRWQILWGEVADKPWIEFVSSGATGAAYGRCFARTETGVYALCPPDTMPNDRLVLLQGAKVPMVLRPAGKNWTLVGECFVYGAMYGELWDQDRCEMLWIE